MAALAAVGVGAQQPTRAPCNSSGWQWRHLGAGGSSGDNTSSGAQQRNVAAAAKRRGPSRNSGSTAGGGGRGRTAPRDRAAVKELAVVLKDGKRQRGDGGGSGGGGGSAGFGPPSGARSSRGGRRGRWEEEEADLEAEGEADWDEELLADLSDSGKPGGGRTAVVDGGWAGCCVPCWLPALVAAMGWAAEAAQLLGCQVATCTPAWPAIQLSS